MPSQFHFALERSRRSSIFGRLEGRTRPLSILRDEALCFGGIEGDRSKERNSQAASTTQLSIRIVWRFGAA